METILLAITAVSLLIALIMSAAAWRMSREERARSTARVAALAAEPDHARDTEASRARAAVQAVELTLNAPAADELPLRSVARVLARPATSAAAASGSLRAEFDASYGETSPKRPEFESRERGPIADSFLGGGAAREQSGGRQRGLMVAAAMLFVLLGGGAYWTISSGSAASTAPASNAPLELISLRHERQGSRLSLSGLVRNPAAGAPIEGLTAVVFLFDAQGGFITSARVGVDFKRLAAGDESPFVVTVDTPSNVARYRVSFRNDAGIVAHVDRRNEQPVATAIVR